MVKSYIDQLGRQVDIAYPPKRIVSLVPSQTELLHDLNLEKQVVGITKFCVHPHTWYKTKTRVGGTKNVNFEKIELLKPDLIIANKEENTQKEIERLSQNYPVWISDIKNLGDSLEMIKSVGEITRRKNEAEKIIENIQNGFASLKKMPNKKKRKIVYLIWHNPIISIGKNTFIDEMLHLNNLDNLMKNLDRYPQIEEDTLASKKPEYIFLSSEPYPFKEKHLAYYQKLVPNAKIILVDGEMFSWYGSRLEKSPEYFRKLAEELLEH